MEIVDRQGLPLAVTLQTNWRSKVMTSAVRRVRRKVDARFNDRRVIPGSGNVFVDLGFDAAEARVMALRLQHIMRLRDRLQEEVLVH